MRLPPWLVIPLSGCVAPSGPVEPYAFVGTWDYGGERLVFTNTTYDDGTGTYPIRFVTAEGRNFTLRFANGYILALAAVTDTGLTRVSGTTGAQVSCRRLA